MTNTNNLPGHLSVKDLAKLLNISIPTVYRLIDSRKIPFYKFGSSIRFCKKDIDEYIESNRFDAIL